MEAYNTYYSQEEIDKIIEAGTPKTASQYEKKLLDISDKLYIFDGLEPDSIQKIVHNVKFNKYKKGQIIISEGDETQEIFFILSGKGAVVVNNTKVVATIDSGNMFGEMAFLTNSPRSATIIAYKENTAIISFLINTQTIEDTSNCPLSNLYQNIALDLSNKLDTANRK